MTKRNLLAIIVLVALAGLTLLQFRLLVIGAKLEKQRFDQKLLVAQRNIRQALNEPNSVSDALITCLKTYEEPNSDCWNVADSLKSLISNEMSKVDISPQFSFAITPRNSVAEVNFTSLNFKKGKFHFHEYLVPLGDYFTRKIYREKTLHIDIEHLFGYLLTELDYLVVPSVLCLLALLICLWLLINILQREQKLNTLKNDFIDSLTHELKTPAFSITLAGRMALEHLKKGNLEKVSEFLRIIETENNKLKNHAEKVLELASLENPKHQLQKQNTDIHALIQEVVSDYDQNFKYKKGKIKTDLRATSFNIHLDNTHFRNVLTNLLDNALKYGGSHPSTTIVSQNDKKAFILKISDNGPGIPQADQKYIFDKFYRVSSQNLQQIKGFGLGLNYVKQVVESHGGKIGVDSKPGKGTTFIIKLPS